MRPRSSPARRANNTGCNILDCHLPIFCVSIRRPNARAQRTFGGRVQGFLRTHFAHESPPPSPPPPPLSPPPPPPSPLPPPPPTPPSDPPAKPEPGPEAREATAISPATYPIRLPSAREPKIVNMDRTADHSWKRGPATMIPTMPPRKKPPNSPIDLYRLTIAFTSRGDVSMLPI